MDQQEVFPFRTFQYIIDHDTQHSLKGKMWDKWIASCKEYGWDPNFSKQPSPGGDQSGTPGGTQSTMNQGGIAEPTHVQQSAGGDLFGTPAEAHGVATSTIAEESPTEICESVVALDEDYTLVDQDPEGEVTHGPDALWLVNAAKSYNGVLFPHEDTRGRSSTAG